MEAGISTSVLFCAAVTNVLLPVFTTLHLLPTMERLRFRLLMGKPLLFCAGQLKNKKWTIEDRRRMHVIRAHVHDIELFEKLVTTSWCVGKCWAHGDRLV